MKDRRLIFLLMIASGVIPLKVFCFSCIQQGPDTITSSTAITGGCIINGDLVILNGGALHVDLTGVAADTFIVRGNILLQGNAVLWINADSGSTGAQFIVSNNFNNQRSITTLDSSKLMLQYVEFRTQEGDLSAASSLYMNYNALNSSAFSATGSWLNPQTAWLLCNLMNHATYIGDESNEVPTEIYLQDSAQMSLSGINTNIGVWLLFSSTTDTLNLPDQTGACFNWQVGRGAGGVNASQWFLNVDSAKPGLGVQVEPFANLVVNGMGVPANGEIHANLLFADGTDTLQNLNAGLQNTVVANGRLKLNNVNLGPIAWQVYAVSNETLIIRNSTINEIGIEGPANTVLVDNSILQLATLSALGTMSSSLTVNNSDIWSQAIVAENSSSIVLNNCNVTGSWFSTDSQSRITVNGGCFFQNPSGCTENTMVNMSTGQPNCNPFIPPGYPNILTPGTISLNSVSDNCATAVKEVNSSPHITIYPNPFSMETRIQSGENFENATLAVYNSLGQQVKQIGNVSGASIILNRDNLPAGFYLIQIKVGNMIIGTEKVVIGDN